MGAQAVSAPWRTGRGLVVHWPGALVLGAARGTSVSHAVPGLVARSCPSQYPSGARAVSMVRRCRRPCGDVLCVCGSLPVSGPGLRAGLLLLPPMATAAGPPGTDRSRPLPTLPAGVYSAGMTNIRIFKTTY